MSAATLHAPDASGQAEDMEAREAARSLWLKQHNVDDLIIEAIKNAVHAAEISKGTAL